MIFLLVNFIVLLFLSNAFLFKEGLWLYQDQSFWFKNYLEAFAFLNTQFHSFNNLSYYLGYDQGILSSNNIFVYTIFLGLFSLFGNAGSQVAVSLLSYIMAFFSFWAFSSLFFKERKMQMILALLYTFNPLMYSFRGQGLIYCAAPLFVYSFYKFYVSKNSGKFLLLNIISSCIWVSNVRFLEANIFIIVPYLFAALLLFHKTKLYLQKLVVYLIINIFLFAPVIYSLFAPLFQRSPSIFNYGVVLNSYVSTGFFYQVFNPFQSFNLILYDNQIYTVLGIGLFLTLLLLLLKHIGKNITPFLSLNIALLVLGMTFFELGTITGIFYPIFIKLIPFLTNAPFYGLYIVNIPFIFLIGIIGQKQRKMFIGLTIYFIILALLPLLNFSYFPLQKYQLNKLPTPYQNYFVEPFYGTPVATDYFPSDCWRAAYMNSANVPTQCIDKGIHYSPIEADNPRVFSGEESYIQNHLYLNQNINNLRITHNLKDIIVAKDIVGEKDAGPQYTSDDIADTKKIDTYFKNDKLLSLQQNNNFDVFSFKNKNNYDFFLYSPQKIFVKNSVDSIFDNSLQLSPRPAVLNQQEGNNVSTNLQQNINISYKQSQFDPTQVYLKLSGVRKDKPFMVQFTQEYRPGWKLLWISKNIYQNKQCINKPVSYSLTNNSQCQFAASLIDPSIISLLGNQSVDSSHHLEGNYITNSWFINPDSIPQYAKDGNEVYAVIVYDDQIYYIITLLMAGGVLLFVCIYTLMQEVKILCQKYL